MGSKELVAGQEIEKNGEISVDIYVAEHCFICNHSYEVAAMIERTFPEVNVRIVNLSRTTEIVPESVFATPTYLLNGRVWSLGNPSSEQVTETLRPMVMSRA